MLYKKIDSFVTLQNKLCKIILILSLSAGLMGVAHILNAYADKSGLDASSDLSAKINTGKSKIGENYSSNINTSSQANSDTNVTIAAKSNSESQYNRNADSNESASHVHYKTAYEKISANSDDEFTVQSERHLYKPGDNVTIEGSIWSSLLSSTGNINTVSIKVTDNDGNVVYDGKSQISDGEYSTVFQLTSEAKKGAYNVDVVADVNADVLNTLSLKTKSNLESSTKIVVVNPNAVSIKANGKDFDVQIASNSTSITNVNYDEQSKKLSFTVAGDAGTKGVTEITIPKSLLNGDFTVMLDGQAMAQSDVVEIANADVETTLEINYHHSTHQIDIIGTSAVPEFNSLALIVLVASISTMIGFSNKIRYLYQ